MKLLYFDDYKLGVLKGDKVVDVSAVVEDIPHLGPHDLMQRADRALRRISRRSWRRPPRRRQGVPRLRRADPPAAAPARQHRLHGGQLHGGRHPQRAGADQRLPQVAERHHRPRRHDGAAGRPGDHLRGRGRDRRRHRQARDERQGRRCDAVHLRLHQLHRRLGARPAAERQRLLPDEVARHLRADRPVSSSPPTRSPIRTSCRSSCGSTAS